MTDITIGVYLKPPCGACHLEDGRHPGCHDRCEKYKEYKAERQRRKDLIADDNAKKMWKRY